MNTFHLANSVVTRLSQTECKAHAFLKMMLPDIKYKSFICIAVHFLFMLCTLFCDILLHLHKSTLSQVVRFVFDFIFFGDDEV